MESYYAKQLECLCSQVRPGDREAMEASKKALEQNCEASGRSGPNGGFTGKNRRSSPQ